MESTVLEKSALFAGVPAEELNGRVIDGQMIDELAPAVRYENGQPVLEISEA